MILIASKEEKEIIKGLREVGGIDKVSGLTTEVLDLKRQIASLEINKSKLKEEHEKEERELRHMIGLEKKRMKFEVEQAKKETMVEVREENLKADKQRFEEQLTFNTKRFESMEKYLKDTLESVLKRLPDVNVKINQGTARK